MILLLRSYTVPSTHPGDPAYDQDFAELWHKRGYVAWGLVPIGDEGSSTGVLAIVGSLQEDARAAAARLLRLGAVTPY